MNPTPSSRLAALAAVAWLAVGLGLAGAASAAPELKFEPRPPAPTDKDPAPPPSLVVTVIGGPGGLAADAFTLRQTDAKLPAIKATGVTRYVEGPEPLGLAVVVEGDANYLGAPGLVAAIESGLGQLATAGPPGSQATVLVYGAGVEVRAPVGPLDQLGAVKLAPKDPPGPKAARALGPALAQAIAALDQMKTPRKALLVIGDGVDGDGATSASAGARTLAAQLTDKQIVSLAIVLQLDKPALGAPEPLPVDPETGMDLPVTPAQQQAYDTGRSTWKRIKDQAADDLKVVTRDNLQRATTVRAVEPAITGFVSALDDRYYVTFPGFDLKTKAGLTWDGKEHPLMLRIDGNDTVAVGVTLAPSWSPPGGGTAWWVFVLIAGGVVAVGGVIIAVVKKPKPLPPPPPVVAPPPQQPPQRQKTMFQGMDSDSVFPVVGWVVFMNGPKRLKFHKIKQGVTKIGTGATSDVVIDDGFMSTDHAMIVMTPEGFWLQDNNSTNGTFLNDNKLAQKQELYDNDLILVGKTVLKFKSTI